MGIIRRREVYASSWTGEIFDSQEAFQKHYDDVVKNTVENNPPDFIFKVIKEVSVVAVDSITTDGYGGTICTCGAKDDASCTCIECDCDDKCDCGAEWDGKDCECVKEDKLDLVKDKEVKLENDLSLDPHAFACEVAKLQDDEPDKVEWRIMYECPACKIKFDNYQAKLIAEEDVDDLETINADDTHFKSMEELDNHIFAEHGFAIERVPEFKAEKVV